MLNLLLDPMSQQHGDFSDFDISLFTLPSPPWHTLFPTDWSPLFPDTVIPMQGADIAVIHYPGDPGNCLPLCFPSTLPFRSPFIPLPSPSPPLHFSIYLIINLLLLYRRSTIVYT